MEGAKKTSGKCSIIVDATTLIHFYEENPNIINLIGYSIGNLFLPEYYLNQTKQLTKKSCENFGITLFSSDVETMCEAGRRIPGLSFSDQICCLEAYKKQLPIYTNDIKIYEFAKKKKIPTHWGYTLIVTLHEKGAMEKSIAIKHTKNICKKIRADFPKNLFH